MNIKNNSAQPKFKTMEFKYINAGEAFEHDGNLYIKIFPLEDNDTLYNAIDLRTGTSEYFTQRDSVHQLHKCEITYEKCLSTTTAESSKL